jgi:protein-disulfide isomerase
MNAKQKQLAIFGGIIAVAVVAVIIAIALSGRTTDSGIDYSSIPFSRTEDGAFVLGNPDAPVTIVEFADFACPHCLDYRPTIDQFVRELVIPGRAKLEFRMFPTAGGQLTVFAGKIAECADNQQAGIFWELHDHLYNLAARGQYNENLGREVAETFNLNYSDLLECTNEAEQVVVDSEFGRARGVQGTPAVMVRYGDGDATFIQFNGQSYDRNAVPFEVLLGVVNSTGA